MTREDHLPSRAAADRETTPSCIQEMTCPSGTPHTVGQLRKAVA